MLITNEAALSTIQNAIVGAVHSLRTVNGGQAQIGTVDPKTLRMAALMAAQMVVGQVVWPDSEIVEIETPQQQIGPFRVRR